MRGRPRDHRYKIYFGESDKEKPRMLLSGKVWLLYDHDYMHRTLKIVRLKILRLKIGHWLKEGRRINQK